MSAKTADHILVLKYVHLSTIKMEHRRAIPNPIALINLPHGKRRVCYLHKLAYKMIRTFALGNNKVCVGLKLV